LGSLLVTAPAQAAGSYRNIVNFGNAKCVDVRTQDDITVQLFSCNDHSNKVFSFDVHNVDPAARNLYQIHPKSSPNNCLTPAGPGIRAQILSRPCDTSAFHVDEWRLQLNSVNGKTWLQIISAWGFCLTVTGGASANGTIIEQNTCNIVPTSAELWRI
jgi:hypothetical protein